MQINYQNNYNIDLEDIKEHLKAIFELILKPSKQVINKIKNKPKPIEFSDNEIQIIRYHMSELYHDMDEISIELKSNDFFYDEYFDFCEIEDMIKFTLNRNLSLITESDFEFISELIKDFYNLIDFKLTLVENKVYDDEKFKHRYNRYLSDFDKSKTYFYKNICDETLDDDLYIKYCNIIME